MKFLNNFREIFTLEEEEKMDFALLDIMKNIYAEKKTEDEDEIPELFFPRRSTRITCAICSSLIGMVISIRNVPIMCCICSNDIKTRYHQIQESFKNRKLIMEKKRIIFEDIITIGMNPDRIEQTDLFETRYLFGTTLSL